ncbi:MAG: hydrogenase formation protein HypD [Myxococcota bacterium]|nr:hydrogenase formation protein HypD [Myxococcota bacterium]
MRSADAHWDAGTVSALARRVEDHAARIGRPVTLMEVCGTHTHAIAEAGLRRLLPRELRLIAGPGCPVCVTPVDYLDRAEALAALPDTTLCSFGDLMRVPSTRGSLEQARARGSDVRAVYSPRDALRIARNEPDRRVVFLAVGFETTVPTMAAALAEAESDGVDNFLLLPGGKLIEPPLRALVADGEVEVDGFLLPGHVSVIIGSDAYAFLVDEFGIPSAVVGFTPGDILLGILDLLEQLGDAEPRVANLYKRVVRPAGNPHAKALVDRFFEPVDSRWRGLGEIPVSALGLRPEWAHRDASRVEVEVPEPREVRGCRCGEVLKGTIEPPECPLFVRACTPERPLGACMVSSEGSCAAWYRHERLAAGARA